MADKAEERAGEPSRLLDVTRRIKTLRAELAQLQKERRELRKREPDGQQDEAPVEDD
jgi:hypothetical protein